MGLWLEARRAGKIPNKRPTETETKNASITEVPEIIV